MGIFDGCMKPKNIQSQPQPQQLPQSPPYTFFPLLQTPSISPQKLSNFKNEKSQFFFVENSTEFRADNCQNCTFLVISQLQAVTIDECKNCQFVILACQGSAFIRDCKNCSFALATAQTRTRDVSSSTFWLWSKTGMIVEGCKNLGIYSFLVRVVPETAESVVLACQKQICEAKIFSNKYEETHDFTNGQSTFSCVTFPELKAGMEAWQLPPICGAWDDSNGNFSTLNVPCVFKSEQGQRKVAVNCNKEVACFIASPIFYKQTGLKCVKTLYDRSKNMKSGKKMFDYYVVVEGNKNLDEVLVKFNFEKQALVCDDTEVDFIMTRE